MKFLALAILACALSTSQGDVYGLRRLLQYTPNGSIPTSMPPSTTEAPTTPKPSPNGIYNHTFEMTFKKLEAKALTPYTNAMGILSVAVSQSNAVLEQALLTGECADLPLSIAHADNISLSAEYDYSYVQANLTDMYDTAVAKCDHITSEVDQLECYVTELDGLNNYVNSREDTTKLLWTQAEEVIRTLNNDMWGCLGNNGSLPAPSQ